MKTFKASIVQKGIVVVTIRNNNKDVVEQEAMHYAMLYSEEEGDIEIKRNYKINNTKPKEADFKITRYKMESKE